MYVLVGVLLVLMLIYYIIAGTIAIVLLLLIFSLLVYAMLAIGRSTGWSNTLFIIPFIAYEPAKAFGFYSVYRVSTAHDVIMFLFLIISILLYFLGKAWKMTNSSTLLSLKRSGGFSNALLDFITKYNYVMFLCFGIIHLYDYLSISSEYPIIGVFGLLYITTSIWLSPLVANGIVASEMVKFLSRRIQILSDGKGKSGERALSYLGLLRTLVTTGLLNSAGREFRHFPGFPNKLQKIAQRAFSRVSKMQITKITTKSYKELVTFMLDNNYWRPDELLQCQACSTVTQFARWEIKCITYKIMEEKADCRCPACNAPLPLNMLKEIEAEIQEKTDEINKEIDEQNKRIDEQNEKIDEQNKEADSKTFTCQQCKKPTWYRLWATAGHCPECGSDLPPVDADGVNYLNFRPALRERIARQERVKLDFQQFHQSRRFPPYNPNPG